MADYMGFGTVFTGLAENLENGVIAVGSVALMGFENERRYRKKQARHYFYESLFWATEPKQAVKMTWQLMPAAPRFVPRSRI